METQENPDEDNRSAREQWEERYASPERVWSGDPNPVLVAETTGLPPGRALDVGCGEGADSLWLATQGWHVTGIDIAANALDKARVHAESIDPAAAVRIEWLQRDFSEWAPELRGYDLVSSQFMHLPEPTMTALHRALAAAVAPGGTLLIVGHDAADFDPDSAHRAHLREKMSSVDDILDAISDVGLEIEVAESRRRTVRSEHAGDFHRDVVVKARSLEK